MGSKLSTLTKGNHQVNHTVPSIFVLPPELRLVIYTQYFSNYDITLAPITQNRKTLQPHALLQTCATIRTEALPVYKQNLERHRHTQETKYKNRVAELGKREIHPEHRRMITGQWRRQIEVIDEELMKVDDEIAKLQQRQ